MLSYTDLKKGTLFVLDGEPQEVLEASFSRMQQRKAVVQAKFRNLATGKIVERSFQPSDTFEEANVQKRPLRFLYHHRGGYVFVEPGDQSKRLSLRAETLGDQTKWLKPNAEVTALFFSDNLLNLFLPIKVDLIVAEAAPGVQGDRSSAGTKAATLETGAVIQTPLFVNTGDTIRVNTQTGEYVERVSKG